MNGKQRIGAIVDTFTISLRKAYVNMFIDLSKARKVSTTDLLQGLFKNSATDKIAHGW